MSAHAATPAARPSRPSDKRRDDVIWYESTARQRIRWLTDSGSFTEFLGPEQREISPHLADFGLPSAFDDGMIVGRAKLGGRDVLLAAQEGQFMGGSFGEVHSAKLTGLLRGAAEAQTAVLLLFDTGGVRLQEANAGELAIAEIMRAVMVARVAGVNVIGLIGGRAGCFGGGSLIAGCCSALAISEQGRLSVSGPEVIETNQGIEEFDSKDRPLVWRTMGGKHRRLLGGVDLFVGDTVSDFRAAAAALLRRASTPGLDMIKAEQARLDDRFRRFGGCVDAVDIWGALGATDPHAIPAMAADAFNAVASLVQEPSNDAR